MEDKVIHFQEICVLETSFHTFAAAMIKDFLNCWLT